MKVRNLKIVINKCGIKYISPKNNNGFISKTKFSKYNNALCSTGFYVINSNFINSESLLVLFKSELIQNVLKQSCSGTILTAINKDDFLNISIPKIIENKQEKIAHLIEESFALKKQSEQLLAVAKRAVEIAIEESEAVALEYIDSRTDWDNTKISVSN